MNKCDNCPCKQLQWACPAKYLPHPRFCELAGDPRYARTIVDRCAKDMRTSDDPPKLQGTVIDANKFHYVDKKINIIIVVDSNDEFAVDLAKQFRAARDWRIHVGGFGILNCDDPRNIHYSTICGDSVIQEAGRAEYIICDDKSYNKLKGYDHKIILLGDKTGGARYYFPAEDFKVGNLYKYIYKIYYTRDEPQDTVTMWRKAWNFGKAMVKHLLMDSEPIQEDIYAKRLSICYGCDRLNITDHTCLECGCPIAKKAKIPSQRCPLNPPLWDAYTMPDDPDPPAKGCGCGK